MYTFILWGSALVTYSAGLLTLTLISLAVLMLVGVATLSGDTLTQTGVGGRVTAYLDSILIADDGVYISISIANTAGTEIKLEYVEVTDGYNIVVYGDNGARDGIPPKYFDSYVDEKVSLRAGERTILKLYHRVPSYFEIGERVTVTVYYSIDGEMYALTIGGKTIKDYERGLTGGNEESIIVAPPPESTAPQNMFMVEFTASKSVFTDTLYFRVTSSEVSDLFTLTNLNDKLRIEDENGTPLKYNVFYYDRTQGIAWIVVKLPAGKQFTRGEKLVLTVYYGVDNPSSNAVTITQRFNPSLMSIDPNGVRATGIFRFDRWVGYQFVTEGRFTIIRVINPYYEDTIPLPSIRVTSIEKGVYTRLEISITTINGTRYLLVMTCSNLSAYYSFYIVEDSGNRLLSNKIGQCLRTPSGKYYSAIVSSERVRSTYLIPAFKVDSPIVHVSIVPTYGVLPRNYTTLYGDVYAIDGRTVYAFNPNFLSVFSFRIVTP